MQKVKMILSKANKLWQSWFGKAEAALKSLQLNAQVLSGHTLLELCPPSSPSHNFTWTILHVIKSYFTSQPGDPGQELGFSLLTKSMWGDAELGIYRISSQSTAQSSSLQVPVSVWRHHPYQWSNESQIPCNLHIKRGEQCMKKSVWLMKKSVCLMKLKSLIKYWQERYLETLLMSSS